jgi:hypothetical protein
MEQFGNNLGDDYFLANYQQLTEYWKKLDKESPRFKLVDIGTTEEGRTQYMAILTSPENHKRLDRYKETSAKLARGRYLDRWRPACQRSSLRSGADGDRLAARQPQ